MRIKLTIEYDGTNYCGWQIQPNGTSVQQVITDAIEKVTGETVKLIGSGRTDAGVHALGQVAHFDANSAVPADKFSNALNAVLPADVKIVKSERADDNFNARFSAKKKTYEYHMYVSPFPRPLQSRYAAQIGYPVNIEAMNSAAARFVGKHDFRCFLAANSSVETTVRTIHRAEVAAHGDEIVFSVTGNGFLYNMVRIMAGTLVAAGEGKITAADVDEMLEKGERDLAGKTMPPQGLVLKSVEYDG